MNSYDEPSIDVKENDPIAIEAIREYNHLDGVRTPLLTEWQYIAEYIIPHKANIVKKTSRPSELEARLYDTTGTDSLLTAAAGLLTWTTPKSAPWFSFEPARQFKTNTNVRKWLAECTSLANEYLANSNFYTQRHESLIDKLAFGTSCMYSALDDKNQTYFQNLEVGSFVMKENYTGLVDTIMRKMELTAEQARKQFGEDNLPKIIIEDLKSNNYAKKHDFLHLCRPREERKVSLNTVKAKNQKPFESLYIHMSTNTIVKESGYDAFPFHVGRWLSWNGMYKGWGYGPGFSVLPDVRQVNWYQKMLDVYTGKVVYPPMLIPNDFEGTLDTSMKAINYYNGVEPERFAPLQVMGDISIAHERLQNRQKSIQAKFFTDLWQMLANRTQQKTATEVLELVNEKLDALSPAFDKDVSEVIEPMLQRLFSLWGSAGMFPPPPEEAVQIVENGFATVPNPIITMSGKLAIAIKQLKNTASSQTLQGLSQVAQMKPDVLDIWNFDNWSKDFAFNAGVDPNYINSDDDVSQIRQQRQQAQAAQAQQQMLMEGAKTLGPDGVQKVMQQKGVM